MPFTSENARENGQKGGFGGRRLDLARAELELGPLETLADLKRRLDRVMSWSAARMLPGTLANAMVRGCDVWLKALESTNSFDDVEQLRTSVADLKEERDRLTGEVATRDVRIAQLTAQLAAERARRVG